MHVLRSDSRNSSMRQDNFVHTMYTCSFNVVLVYNIIGSSTAYSRLLQITACAAALCSVKDGISSNAKPQYLTAQHTPTLWPINTKLGKVNTVGEFYKFSKLHCSQLRNGAPTYWWNITPMCLFSVCKGLYIGLYIFSSADPQPDSILTHDGSNDADWSKCFLGVKNGFWGQQLQKPPIFWRQ